MPVEDQDSAFTNRNDDSLQKSEEWYTKSVEELSEHVYNLYDMWKDALEQRELILSLCCEHFHHNVDVVTEIRMERVWW